MRYNRYNNSLPYQRTPRPPRVNDNFIRSSLTGVGCLIALGLLGTDTLNSIPYGIGAIASTLFEIAGYFPIVIIGGILFLTARRVTGLKLIAMAWLLFSVIPGLMLNIGTLPISFIPVLAGIFTTLGGVGVCLLTISSMMILYPKW